MIVTRDLGRFNECLLPDDSLIIKRTNSSPYSGGLSEGVVVAWPDNSTYSPFGENKILYTPNKEIGPLVDDLYILNKYSIQAQLK